MAKIVIIGYSISKRGSSLGISDFFSKNSWNIFSTKEDNIVKKM